MIADVTNQLMQQGITEGWIVPLDSIVPPEQMAICRRLTRQQELEDADNHVWVTIPDSDFDPITGDRYDCSYEECSECGLERDPQ